MFFKKKKRMIDIRELQKRGIVRPPKKETFVPTNSDGFVELSANQQTAMPNPFNFMDTPSTNSQLQSSHSRLTDLDNKIYKLEQRIELLEKKLGVNQNQKLGPMGW